MVSSAEPSVNQTPHRPHLRSIKHRGTQQNYSSKSLKLAFLNVFAPVDLHHLQACQRLAARSLPVVVVVIQWAIENSDCHKPHASIPTSERSFTGSWSSSWGSFATKSGFCFAFSSVWSVCSVLWLLLGFYFGFWSVWAGRVWVVSCTLLVVSSIWGVWIVCCTVSWLFVVCSWLVFVMSSRGRGSCPRCDAEYFNRSKPPNFGNCGHQHDQCYHLVISISSLM